MILSRRVALGGAELDEIDESVVIRSVLPGTPKETSSTVSRMTDGQRITTRHWDSLEVKVRFAINIPKRQLERRREVFEAVCAWALQKGWLTVNYMAGKRVWVDRVVLPDSGDLWDWTAEYEISFMAHGVPFWQDESPASAAANITQGRMTLDVRGHVRTVMDVEFRNISGLVIPNISVRTPMGAIALTGINLGGTSTLKIHHGTDGILRATVGTASVYEKITGADDLYVNPGSNAIDITATRMGRVTLTSYGRYL